MIMFITSSVIETLNTKPEDVHIKVSFNEVHLTNPASHLRKH